MFGAPRYLADPFPRYHKFFNVHKIDVVSNQSGADNPFPDGIFRDTALNATYDTLGLARLLTINEEPRERHARLRIWPALASSPTFGS